MSTHPNPQKLVSFTYKKTELEAIQQELDNGWIITSIINNGPKYICMMEKVTRNDNETIFIPPRKKIHLSN